MKSLRPSPPSCLALLLGAVLSCVAPAFGQGALTPPGAPAPMGRTLTQVEPRIDLSTLPSTATAVISITQSGSYYATGNIAGAAGKNTIEVIAAGVTIDLNGFNVTNTDAANSAIHAVSFSGTTVRNGRILSGAYGVRATSRLVCSDLTIEGTTNTGILGGTDSHVLRCRVITNGIQLSTRGLVEDCVTSGAPGVVVGISSIVRGTRVASGGIVGGNDVQVHDCNVSTAPVCGIDVGDRAVLRNCTVNGAARSGILTQDYARLSGCSVSSAGTGVPLATDGGFALGGLCVAENCTANSCAVSGFVTANAVQLRSCLASSNTGSGIVCTTQARLLDCTSASNSLLGISVGARSVVTGCSATANSNGGIYATGNGALIEKCLAMGNTSGSGIRVDTGTIRDSEVRENLGGAGIRVSSGSHVIGNTSSANGVAGIPQDGFLIEGGRARVEGNHAYNNVGFGFTVTNASSTNSVLFIGNSAGSNDTGEFSIGAGNAAGPILAPSGVATNTNPAANFNL